MPSDIELAEPLKRRVIKAPAVRREALVDATLRCLKEFGHEGVSVRRISAAAGVSIGLINHRARFRAHVETRARSAFAKSRLECRSSDTTRTTIRACAPQ